jgi:hypothetical protein
MPCRCLGPRSSTASYLSLTPSFFVSSVGPKLESALQRGERRLSGPAPGWCNRWHANFWCWKTGFKSSPRNSVQTVT